MPLFWLSLAFIIGILLAAALPWAALTWLWLAGGALLLLVFLLLSPRWFQWLSNRLPLRFAQRLSQELIVNTSPRPATPSLKILIALSLLTLCLGGWRYTAALPQYSPDFIATYNDTDVKLAVVGVVSEPPDGRDTYTNLRIRTETLRLEDDINHFAVHGLLLARVPNGETWHYGDRVILTGYLETPPEDEAFSYRDYLARQGVYSMMRYGQPALLESGGGNRLVGWVYTFKEQALAMVYRLFPDPEASLMAGILLGVESGIPENVRGAFNDTGTSHVIAISGFNITIIAGIFMTFFSRWLGRWRGAVVAVIGIAIYTFLVGADAAVVRAALMGGLALFAQQVGRRQLGLNSLAFVAAVMAIFNPQVPWDVGFQLSFAATLGLVLYAGPLGEWFVRFASRHLPNETVERIAGPVGEYFLYTLAAQITTLPIIIYHFQRFSISSFPANVFILPAQPPVMILGGVAVLLGLLVRPVGQLFAYLTWPFVAYTIRMVEWFAQFKGGVYVTGQVGLWAVVGFYAALFAATLWWDKLQERTAALRPATIFVSLALFASLTWQAALTAPDGMLHLTVLDVGTGDGLLIQTPEGRYVLVDGGPSATRLSDALGRRLPLFHRQLDVLVVAGPREEQIAALPSVVERFPPGEVLWAGPLDASDAARYLQRGLAPAEIPITSAENGHALELGQGARLEVLSVSERGMILLLQWEHFRALLPLGADFAALEELRMGKEIGPVTALLLADNGYAPLNPPQWIANLNPGVVLLSVEAGDYDGLPSPETLETVAAYNLLRTDQNGWLHLSTDGEQLWVEVERGTSSNAR
ncbi:MAG: ComEC/Rec2 family competence protein [Anaerolineales bacterium]|nr:ComEC/Rec2 family competence protein [Anaerolineales bacterium]